MSFPHQNCGGKKKNQHPTVLSVMGSMLEILKGGLLSVFQDAKSSVGSNLHYIGWLFVLCVCKLVLALHVLPWIWQGLLSWDHCWSLLTPAGSVLIEPVRVPVLSVSFRGHLLLGSVAKLLLDPVYMVLYPNKSIKNCACWWGQCQKQLRPVSSVSI